ncbi:sulfite exporter TauE/SafE family protein [soil metagenome]
MPSFHPKPCFVTSRLCSLPLPVNVSVMSSSNFDSILFIIAAVFLLAGFVKGTIGMGLPTVAIGLLATKMSPAHALAIVIVPAIVTNIWQTFVGPYLRDILHRLWPLLIGTVLGVWSGGGLLTGPYAPYCTIVLGVLLVIYAIVGLSKVSFSVHRRNEGWVGGIVGVLTGLIAAATGVQVIPSMPFMQAIGMEKDELVQALGVFFTTATLAQAYNLTGAGLLNTSTLLPGTIGMIAAFAGMFIGQSLRSRMDADTFRRWFLIAMLLLGLYLAGEMLMQLSAWSGAAAR